MKRREESANRYAYASYDYECEKKQRETKSKTEQYCAIERVVSLAIIFAREKRKRSEDPFRSISALPLWY